MSKENNFKPRIGYMQDHTGDKSSKRLAGFICLGNGLLMKNWLVGYGSFKKLATEFSVLDSSADTLILTGAGLLCWSVLDYFKGKFSKNKSKKK